MSINNNHYNNFSEDPQNISAENPVEYFRDEFNLNYNRSKERAKEQTRKNVQSCLAGFFIVGATIVSLTLQNRTAQESQKLTYRSTQSDFSIKKGMDIDLENSLEKFAGTISQRDYEVALNDVMSNLPLLKEEEKSLFRTCVLAFHDAYGALMGNEAFANIPLAHYTQKKIKEKHLKFGKEVFFPKLLTVLPTQLELLAPEIDDARRMMFLGSPITMSRLLVGKRISLVADLFALYDFLPSIDQELLQDTQKGILITLDQKRKLVNLMERFLYSGGRAQGVVAPERVKMIVKGTEGQDSTSIFQESEKYGAYLKDILESRDSKSFLEDWKKSAD